MRSMDELEEFRELLMNEKLTKLMGMLDSVNPKVEAVRRRKGEEIIEL